ncbi:MAG: hypothetical protein HC923_10515 [Myxococcales bacterium]|nr:hypothetical protein [Myxococcales bacterium]
MTTVDRIHDLGKIQFALIALWAYLNFSQLLIIWYANLPEEIIWYAHRTRGGYEYLAAFLVFGQFFEHVHFGAYVRQQVDKIIHNHV